MNNNTKKWSLVANKLRQVLGLAPPSWEEADAEMAEAKAVPITDEEIERIANGAARQEKHKENK